MQNKIIIKGDLVFSKDQNQLEQIQDGYLLVEDGIIVDLVKTKEEIPVEWKEVTLKDYSNQLVLPGLVDLHVHAPQYPFRALGMDMELLPWLEKYAFPEETKYKDTQYAKDNYPKFVNDLVESGTTRVGIFGTIHRESTKVLMDLLEQSGMVAYVGKVNMDRNSPEYLIEETKESVEETIRFFQEVGNKYENVKPIITPRFVPSCTSELMEQLGKMSEEYGIPVQSHLSENPSEIEWVADLHKNSTCYGDVYDQFGLFGQKQKGIMAHCVYSTMSPEEMELLKTRNIWVAHCPESNMNLTSGLAPIKKYLKEKIKVGLGSDIAGGTKLSIFSAMADAIRMSKLYKIYVDKAEDILTIPEVFYMATLGGGSFFGKVGTFQKGYEFDCIVLDDTDINQKGLTLFERLERTIYYGEQGRLVAKYIRGKEIK